MPSHRLRFEILFALGWLTFGALVLPALVYGVGVVLLGTYADGGLGAFYANLYGDLLSGSLAAAALIFGPYVLLMLARVPLLGRRRTDAPSADDDEPPSARSPRTTGRTSRIEPRIGN